MSQEKPEKKRDKPIDDPRAGKPRDGEVFAVLISDRELAAKANSAIIGPSVMKYQLTDEEIRLLQRMRDGGAAYAGAYSAHTVLSLLKRGLLRLEITEEGKKDLADALATPPLYH